MISRPVFITDSRIAAFSEHDGALLMRDDIFYLPSSDISPLRYDYLAVGPENSFCTLIGSIVLT